MNKENSLSDFHKTLLKTIPFGLQIVDTTGKILYSNERMQGFVKGETIGSRCWEIYKIDKKQCRDCPLKGEIKKGETIVTEVNNIVNGGTFLIHHNRMVFNGEDALLEVFQDITERKAVEETNKKLTIAVEQSPAIIMITDAAGNIEYVNRKFEQTTGYSFEEVRGKNPKILNSGKLPAEKYKELWETISKKREWRGEFINRKNNGEIYYESALISPIQNEFSEITHFIAIKEDITEIKKTNDELKKSEKHYSSLFENMMEGFAYCEMLYDGNKPDDFRYIHVNHKFYELTGLMNVTGKKVSEVIPGIQKTNPEIIKLYGKVAATGEPEKFEVYLKDLEKWFNISVYSTEKNFFITIFDNITERKSSEESIKKMTSKLVEQNKNLEQFAYIISHNLRSPVANITGIAHILEEYETNPDEKDEMLKLLFSSVKMLDKIIHDLNNILEVKKEINEKKEKIYFSELLNDVLKIIEGVIKKEGAMIRSDFKEADEIITLKSYMHSIFYNLITNGIKYRRENITPVIEVESTRKNNKIELIFRDNGIGIDLMNSKDVVFGLYKRFHSHVEGKGMGLFMTKMQVESLGGKISINSEVNKGTEFKIEFDV